MDQHPKMKYVYVGVDSHKDTHCAVMLNCFFEKLEEVTFRNTPTECDRFLQHMNAVKPPGISLAFGLEDVSAYGRHLLLLLKQNNAVVKHVNAGLVANERKSYSNGEKTDAIDAECAARVLLSRFDALPDADSQDKYWILHGIVVRRRNIVKLTTNLKNHLHSYLTGHYPHYSEFFSEIDSLAALTFYEHYPSPSHLKGVSSDELYAFLKQHSPLHNWRAKAQEILAYVEADGSTKSDYQEARDALVYSIIRQIRTNQAELETVTDTLAEFLTRFEYKLETMAGIDVVTAAELIAEIGDISKFDTPAKLARYAGIAPITFSSGKSDVKAAHQRGNRTLNWLLYQLSIRVTMVNNNVILNPIFYRYYQKKISEGKTKRQALKCVQRRLVNILWQMMTYKTEYLNPPQEDIREGPVEDVSPEPGGKMQAKKAKATP
jgi:transposase